MLSKEVEIPLNLHNDSIYSVVDQCFSKEYVVSKVSDQQFRFKKLLRTDIKRRDSMRRLTVLDRGEIRIEDRKMWIKLDVKRIIFFNVFFGLLFVYVYWALFFLLFPLVFSSVVAITIFSWFVMIRIGNNFIDERIETLRHLMSSPDGVSLKYQTKK